MTFAQYCINDKRFNTHNKTAVFCSGFGKLASCCAALTEKKCAALLPVETITLLPRTDWVKCVC